MKTAITIVAVLMIALSSATASATPKTFLPSEGDWDVNGNWFPTGAPGAGDSATIPNGKICSVISGGQPVNEACDWIDVQTGGRLWIRKGSTLTILTNDEDSTVDGEIWIGVSTPGDNKLLIADDVTIKGSGGVILMGPDSVIDDDGTSDYRLTIEGDGTCAPPGYSCSVVVRGEGGDIKVTLTNNAFVIPGGATSPCGTLNPITLSENAKNGNGVWGATNGGHLQVDVEVTGAATWAMVDEDSTCASAAKITINDCTRVLGDVILEHGTFVVNEKFCTRGDLTWKSVSDSEPTIEVASGKPGRFGIIVCTTCN